jgi:hypothetical protein
VTEIVDGGGGVTESVDGGGGVTEPMIAGAGEGRGATRYAVQRGEVGIWWLSDEFTVYSQL